MKTKKRRLEYYSFYDHTGIEQHLTEMAKKGWLLESISNLYWTYREIEPREIHFCVTYYPRASDFDPGPSEDQQTFHDLCAHTGWQLACTWHQMQVFYNEKESPIPLDTDPIMEVDTLHRACKKNFLPSYYFLLALGVLMGGYFLAEIYFAPVTLLSNSSQMLSGFAYLCVLVISLTELCTYFSWYRKAKKAAQDDIFVDTPSTKLIQQTVVIVLLFAAAFWILNLFTLSNRMLAWIAVAMLICMFAIIFAVNRIKHGLRKLKASRGLNRVLTLTACFILPTVMMGGITYATLSGIHFSIQRMIRSAADQMRDIKPIISIVGTARIAMIPKANANTAFGKILLILPCCFLGSFRFIKVFTVHLHGTGEILVHYHNVVSAVIKLEGSLKVSVSIRFQFYYLAIHADTNRSVAGFRFNMTG